MGNFSHGKVKLKTPILDINENEVVSENEIGTITAYLPEMETFAIMFSRDRWITFKETEEEFKNKVKFIDEI